MEQKYGFPIVTAATFSPTLEELGLKPWPEIKPAMSLREYAALNLAENEKRELERFAPKTEVVFFKDPKGDEFRGFRTVGKDWATVFTLLPEDLVPVVVEWKHGAEIFSIGFPSGVPTKSDHTMEECIRREFKEETGFQLQTVTPLTTQGIAVSSRQTTLKYFPFLGELKTPIARLAPELDADEYLRVLLVPLIEWIEMINKGLVLEDCAISITLLALKRLGRLQLSMKY